MHAVEQEGLYLNSSNIDFFVQPLHMWGVIPKNPSATTDELLTVTINDLARGGSGVAREQSGRVIFVPWTAPGDEVRVRITETNKRYAQGELVEILKASPDRQTPRCPLFGRCGGCQWQHLPYDLQWKTKARGVQHALQRVGIDLTTLSKEEFPAAHPWEYRNRIQLRGDGHQMGFFAAKSHELVAAESCPIARPELNAIWSEVREEGAKLPKPYKVEIEVLPGGQIRKTWNSAHGAAGFRQIFDAQNAKLQKWVATQTSPNRVLLDLFGGSGNLSLGLVDRMTTIHCVDVSTPLQAPTGTPSHFRFHRIGVLPWLLNASPSGTASAILDPPRIGLDPHFSAIASALERLRVNEIIAVGCDPDSWIKDVSRWIQRGWKLEKIALFDFFPQTPHVESAALLRI